MAFFSLCPRDKKYLEYTVTDIPLTVVQDDGVELTPDVKTSVTDLSGGHHHFYIRAGNGTRFNLTVMVPSNQMVKGTTGFSTNTAGDTGKNVVVHQSIPSLIDDGVSGYVDENGGAVIEYDDPTYGSISAGDASTVAPWDVANVTNVLNYIIRHTIPVYIKSDGLIGVPSSNLYLITENKSRKQVKRGYTLWDLTFTKVVPVNYPKFNKTNKGITKALKKLKAKKTKKAKTVSAKTKLRLSLRKCKVSVLVYSKKKKTVACVKTLQKYLNENLGTKLTVDGWFGKETKNAVTKYQKKYAKTYGLKATGKVDNATYNVIIGKGKPVKNSKVTVKKTGKSGQIGKTITIKQGSMKGILK